MQITKIGVCPWCGEETMLFFTMKNYPGTKEFWMDFICGRCLELSRRLRRKNEDGE